MAKLRISMQYVWVLVFLSIVLVFLLPQNAEATEWYLGINLKEGDFFRYNLCSIDFENCKPFESGFWVYGKTDYISYGDKIDVWKVKAIVIEENKTIISDMLLGAVDYKPVSSSKEIQQYAHAFRPSINHLSQYALSLYPKSLESPYWCPIAILGGICLDIMDVEKISVASETFDAYLLRYDSDRYDIKIWLDKDLAFPLKGYDFYTDKEGNKFKYYEFELLEFGNSQTPPHFLESFNIEESTTCPKAVYMDEKHEKYSINAIQCVEQKIKNCENQTTTFWYQPGPLNLIIGGKDDGKCSISIERQDWGDYGVRTSNCDIPLIEMANWKSWKKPDGKSFFEDLSGKNYCYAYPVELTVDQILEMQNALAEKYPPKIQAKLWPDDDVVCKTGLLLVLKATDGSPACVKPKTAKKLIERGWASS